MVILSFILDDEIVATNLPSVFLPYSSVGTNEIQSDFKFSSSDCMIPPNILEAVSNKLPEKSD
jgi:hypothetical protein